jgi:hypothetical protein
MVPVGGQGREDEGRISPYLRMRVCLLCYRVMRVVSEDPGYGAGGGGREGRMKGELRRICVCLCEMISQKWGGREWRMKGEFRRICVCVCVYYVIEWCVWCRMIMVMVPVGGQGREDEGRITPNMCVYFCVRDRARKCVHQRAK